MIEFDITRVASEWIQGGLAYGGVSLTANSSCPSLLPLPFQQEEHCTGSAALAITELVGVHVTLPAVSSVCGLEEFVGYQYQPYMLGMDWNSSTSGPALQSFAKALARR